MPERRLFDYAVLRVVPRVDREEFLNVGVFVHSPALAFLGCHIALDRSRLKLFGTELDVDALECELDALRLVCLGDPSAGPIAKLSRSERFHWLTAPRSAVVQPSPIHPGLCEDPQLTLDRLFTALVATKW